MHNDLFVERGEGANISACWFAYCRWDTTAHTKYGVVVLVSLVEFSLSEISVYVGN